MQTRIADKSLAFLNGRDTLTESYRISIGPKSISMSTTEQHATELMQKWFDMTGQYGMLEIFSAGAWVMIATIGV